MVGYLWTNAQPTISLYVLVLYKQGASVVVAKFYLQDIRVVSRKSYHLWSYHNFMHHFLYSIHKHYHIISVYWAVQKNLVKGCRQTLDRYCVSCVLLLSASIADGLWFVNMVCLPLIANQNAHEICLTQECLQIVRRLPWKQTTHSLRNSNPMFDGNLWPNTFEQPSILELNFSSIDTE